MNLEEQRFQHSGSSKPGRDYSSKLLNSRIESKIAQHTRTRETSIHTGSGSQRTLMLENSDISPISQRLSQQLLQIAISEQLQTLFYQIMESQCWIKFNIHRDRHSGQSRDSKERLQEQEGHLQPVFSFPSSRRAGSTLPSITHSKVKQGRHKVQHLGRASWQALQDDRETTEPGKPPG